MQVDRGQSVIRNVKLLGLESKNGRTYKRAAVERARALYEGAKVNVDHAARPNAPRSYADRIGQLRNVRSDGSGLRADLLVNPKHAVAEQLLWDAENMPAAVGLSHNVEAKVSREGGRVVVEEIVRVLSVDLVADPATTRGLHESTGDQAGNKAALLAEVGAQVGLPAAALAAIDTGPGSFVGEHCDTPEQLREHLEGIKRHLVEAGLLVDRRQAVRGFADRADGDPDFLEAVTGNRRGGDARFNDAVFGIGSDSDQAAFRAAVGLPSRNGDGKRFRDEIS